MDHITKKRRSWNMSRIRSKNTAPEKAVRKVLAKLSWHYRLHSSKLRGNPDIVIPKINTAIFVNGCFWHQHKGCKKRAMPKTNMQYWKPKLKRNIEKQMADIKKLKRGGWKVLIVWECETKNEKRLIKKFRKLL